jgi:dissimilatory sulfite reductase (desulfoviridin) alpha/beta subunit
MLVLVEEWARLVVQVVAVKVVVMTGHIVLVQQVQQILVQVAVVVMVLHPALLAVVLVVLELLSLDTQIHLTQQQQQQVHQISLSLVDTVSMSSQVQGR